MASEENDPLKDLTDCSLCCSPLLEPKILPCGHTYCRDCIEKLYQSNMDQFLICPDCRTVHYITSQQIPTDFKLKQVVEMMHRMGQDNVVTDKKVCSNCALVGDIQNYFICETCADGNLVSFHCSRCIVKKHQSHKIKDPLEETKIKTNSTIDKNLQIIGEILGQTEFYVKRYENQNNKLAFLFHLLLDFCEQTKKSVDEDFKFEHGKMAELLTRFLEKAHQNMNTVLNQTDNAIHELCRDVSTTFQGSFEVPSTAMDHLKTKINNLESIDLFQFLFNMPNDELPTIEQGPSSSTTPIEISVPHNVDFRSYNHNISPRYEGPMEPTNQVPSLDPNFHNLTALYENRNDIQRSPSSRIGYGKAVLNRNKKKR